MKVSKSKITDSFKEFKISKELKQIKAGTDKRYWVHVNNQTH